MKRRTFLQILAAAAVLPLPPKLKVIPGPCRLEMDGFIFIEDPDPLRFILTPTSHVEEPSYEREVRAVEIIECECAL